MGRKRGEEEEEWMEISQDGDDQCICMHHANVLIRSGPTNRPIYGRVFQGFSVYNQAPSSISHYILTRDLRRAEQSCTLFSLFFKAN